MTNTPSTTYRVESFTSEDNKIHGIAHSSTSHAKAEKDKEFSRLVAGAYWIEVFDAETNELVAEYFPE